MPTILLVDDDADALMTLRRVFHKEKNYRLLYTDDPRRAAGLLGGNAVDVVLSDVDMPGMSGLELMEIARKVCPRAVRVLVTGVHTVEAATCAINQGEVHRFVHKPYQPAKVRSIVAEAVARQSELGRATAAGRQIERRKLLLQQLETEHPGITELERDPDEAYCIDIGGAAECAARVGLGALLADT